MRVNKAGARTTDQGLLRPGARLALAGRHHRHRRDLLQLLPQFPGRADHHDRQLGGIDRLADQPRAVRRARAGHARQQPLQMVLREVARLDQPEIVHRLLRRLAVPRKAAQRVRLGLVQLLGRRGFPGQPANLIEDRAHPPPACAPVLLNVPILNPPANRCAPYPPHAP